LQCYWRLCLFWCPSAFTGFHAVSGVPAIVNASLKLLLCQMISLLCCGDVLALCSIPAEVPAIAEDHTVADISTISGVYAVAVPYCYYSVSDVLSLVLLASPQLLASLM
jgi:hypothetical protein